MVKQAAFDWSQFHLGIIIKARPETLYDLWTTSEGLTRWFLRSAAFAPSDGPPANRRQISELPPFEELNERPDGERCRPNDRYHWEWHYNGGLVCEDWIIASRPPTKLTFGFGDRMEVEILLRKQGAFCEVNLRQYNIPTTLQARSSIHMGCRIAWAFFLTNLKSIAEGGLDLRETDLNKTRRLHLVNM